jgi:hypothetical protein
VVPEPAERGASRSRSFGSLGPVVERRGREERGAGVALRVSRVSRSGTAVEVVDHVFDEGQFPWSSGCALRGTSGRGKEREEPWACE